ncbi:unannotated protein [freshwater metagenome]|uniref:Unannotated protein n=1 Tax=freshwater metagenome TaxID=449393 RepID=A0A6J7LGB0_9ZZZZ
MGSLVLRSGVEAIRRHNIGMTEQSRGLVQRATTVRGRAGRMPHAFAPVGVVDDHRGHAESAELERPEEQVTSEAIPDRMRRYQGRQCPPERLGQRHRRGDAALHILQIPRLVVGAPGQHSVDRQSRAIAPDVGHGQAHCLGPPKPCPGDEQDEQPVLPERGMLGEPGQFCPGWQEHRVACLPAAASALGARAPYLAGRVQSEASLAHLPCQCCP